MAFTIPSAVLFYVFLFSLLPLAFYGLLEEIVKLLTPRRYKYKKDIVGKVVLITGAGSGIGRELAVQLSRKSNVLVLLDLNKNSLYETEELLDAGSSAHLYQCDVTDRQKVYEVARNVKNDVGKVDVLVNNAGIVTGKFFLDCSDEMIQKTMEVNAMAHFWTCKAFLPDMVSSNSGHVVCVSSVAGATGCPGLVDYCGSKFAAYGLTDAMAVEMRSRGYFGIKFSIVCPVIVSTGMFEGSKPPFGLSMTPQHVAREIIAGIRLERERIFLPGFVLQIIMMKWFMPQRAVHAFQRSSGLFNLMGEFKGRVSNINKKLK